MCVYFKDFFTVKKKKKWQKIFTATQMEHAVIPITIPTPPKTKPTTNKQNNKKQRTT